MADSHANFAYSTVATAPSPATSGTSLVVASGQGALFPAVPFNATIWPTGAQPTTLNAEIVRVTARSTDTLTITRAQEGTTARTVVVGDQITAGITAKTLTDAEGEPGSSLRDVYLRPSVTTYETMTRAGQATATLTLVSGTLVLVAVALPKGVVINNITFVSAATSVSPTHWWFGLYDSSRVQLATTADQTTTAWTSNTVKTVPVATIATGASSTFTTTYEGLHYIGIMMAGSTPGSMVSANISAAVASMAPILAGTSSTTQTTPPAFPFTAAALTATTLVPYAGVA